MKILIFSDLHIHHTHRFSQITSDGLSVRELEQLSCADRIIDLLKEDKEINRVVCCGDLISTVGDSLSTEVLYTLSLFLKKLQEYCLPNKIEIDILVGNHDLSGHLNINYIHKLYPFSFWEGINIYDKPTQKGDFIYMPYSISDNIASNFLESIKEKEDRIVFSHLELKGIDLGNGIVSNKGVDKSILENFKIVFQGHYHSGIKYGRNINIIGSTQRFSFKDLGKSRNNIIIYDLDNNTFIRKSFLCPDWLTFNDDNIDEILNIDNNNYVKVDLSTDLLLTDKIKNKLESVKGKDISISLNRISGKSVSILEEDNRDNMDDISIIKRFIDNTDNDNSYKEKLLNCGISILKEANHT